MTPPPLSKYHKETLILSLIEILLQISNMIVGVLVAANVLP
jgi:hypothetical protein